MSRFLGIVVAMSITMSWAYAGGSRSKAEWGYEGERGPAHWATLCSEFGACAGKNQSPIDLQTKAMIDADLRPIHFSYGDGDLDMLNNGHSVKVVCAPGSWITIDRIRFHLLQFHFHAPSENHIDGRSFPLEAHFVHSDKNGNLAVVAVLYEEGESHGSIRDLRKHLPFRLNENVTPSGVKVRPAEFLPAGRTYYRFNGSLTTPPCSEGVRWIVCREHPMVSQGQVRRFRRLMHHDNNRPVQPVNARPVLK